MNHLLITGYEVVCLPVAHCELNPMEMAWARLKGYVKENNKRYSTCKAYITSK